MSQEGITVSKKKKKKGFGIKKITQRKKRHNYDPQNFSSVFIKNIGTPKLIYGKYNIVINKDALYCFWLNSNTKSRKSKQIYTCNAETSFRKCSCYQPLLKDVSYGEAIVLDFGLMPPAGYPKI